MMITIAALQRFFDQPLAEWGIRRIHGLPGDGVNGTMGAKSLWKGHARKIGTVPQTFRDSIEALVPHQD